MYELPDAAYDALEHKMVPLASVRNISNRVLYKMWLESPTKRIVRSREVGFDPSESDTTIRCNLWGGWPTQPSLVTATHCSSFCGTYAWRGQRQRGVRLGAQSGWPTQSNIRARR